MKEYGSMDDESVFQTVTELFAMLLVWFLDIPRRNENNIIRVEKL